MRLKQGSDWKAGQFIRPVRAPCCIRNHRGFVVCWRGLAGATLRKHCDHPMSAAKTAALPDWPVPASAQQVGAPSVRRRSGHVTMPAASAAATATGAAAAAEDSRKTCTDQVSVFIKPWHPLRINSNPGQRLAGQCRLAPSATPLPPPNLRSPPVWALPSSAAVLHRAGGRPSGGGHHLYRGLLCHCGERPTLQPDSGPPSPAAPQATGAPARPPGRPAACACSPMPITQPLLAQSAPA